MTRNSRVGAALAADLHGVRPGADADQPGISARAIPIMIQVYLNAGVAYALNRALGVPHNIACPSALIGASNFFELAVAAAIALFGFDHARRARHGRRGAR